MVKFNWENLKKEYILGDYKSLTDFARKKKLKRNGNFLKQTSGWIEEKAKFENQKSTKIVQKVQEKIIEKEVNERLNFIDTFELVHKAIREYLIQRDYFYHVAMTKYGTEVSREHVLNDKALLNLVNALDKSQKAIILGDKGDLKQEDNPLFKIYQEIEKSKQFYNELDNTIDEVEDTENKDYIENTSDDNNT